MGNVFHPLRERPGGGGAETWSQQGGQRLDRQCVNEVRSGYIKQLEHML